MLPLEFGMGTIILVVFLLLLFFTTDSSITIFSGILTLMSILLILISIDFKGENKKWT